MRRRKSIIALAAVIGALFIAFGRQPEPVLSLESVRQFEAQSELKPDSKVDVVLMYAALASSCSQPMRAYEMGGKLMEKDPEYGARADVRETQRQLAASSYRNLRQRGVESQMAYELFLSHAASLARSIERSTEVSDQDRSYLKLAEAIIELSSKRPRSALTIIEGVHLPGDEVVRTAILVDALTDLGQYSRAMRILTELPRQLKIWQPKPPDKSLKLLSTNPSALAVPVSDATWIQEKKRIAATLQGSIALRGSILAGLARLESR